MKKQKWTASMISVAVIGSLIMTGCGSAADTSTKAETEAETASETKTEAAEKGADETQTKENETKRAEDTSKVGSDSSLPTDLGLEKIGNGEKLVIGLQQNQYIEDYENNWFTNMLEEELGIEIEFYILPSATSDFQTKVSPMMAGERKYQTL